jgi:hypothetical protein
LKPYSKDVLGEVRDLVQEAHQAVVQMAKSLVLDQDQSEGLKVDRPQLQNYFLREVS